MLGCTEHQNQNFVKPLGQISGKMFKGGTMDMFRSEEMQLMQVSEQMHRRATDLMWLFLPLCVLIVWVACS